MHKKNKFGICVVMQTLSNWLADYIFFSYAQARLHLGGHVKAHRFRAMAVSVAHLEQNSDYKEKDEREICAVALKFRPRVPGLRGVRTSSLFRAVNPELFIRPNKSVMAFGLISLTLCVAYIGYLHAVEENKKDLYEAIDSEGTRYMKRKSSRWD
ncbi:small integral membrane protein 8-like [Rhinatrema bivittatum]|uniref:small integral membrane protein 8-like n=1 Tax=Rhinatrema bivittatum TaxID=194408 RepID=UPI00112BD65E|nr:small integral membrane protein 8-like [Rhinatrema bivittatum]